MQDRINQLAAIGGCLDKLLYCQGGAFVIGGCLQPWVQLFDNHGWLIGAIISGATLIVNIIFKCLHFMLAVVRTVKTR